MKTALIPALLGFLLVACGGPDPAVGHYEGRMDKSAFDETFPAGSQKQAEADEMLATMRGSLTLDANRSVTETMNFKDKYIPTGGGEHSTRGKWVHNGSQIRLHLDDGTEQTFTVSSDGKTLTMPGWTFTKTP